MFRLERSAEEWQDIVFEAESDPVGVRAAIHFELVGYAVGIQYIAHFCQVYNNTVFIPDIHPDRAIAS